MSKIRKFFKMGLGEMCYRVSEIVYNSQSKKRLFAKKYIFDDRQSGSENLLIIVAGFQPYYWDQVFARVNNSCETFGESIDICVCVPEGIEGSKDNLRKRCEQLGWSFLYIHLDLLSQVQNTAIQLHPSAQWIYKIDEDIIMSQDYFRRLKQSYVNADSKSYYPIGFMGPLLNINAACAPYFLESVDAYEEYKTKYGEYRIKFQKEDDLIHKSTELAEFIWEKSVPFDEVAACIYSKNKGNFVVSPVRYSIGAILFKREYWEQIGCFKVGILGQMGLEEEQICGFSSVNFKPIFIALDVFAGHLGFYTQKETCRRFFEQHSEDIFLKKNNFEENDNVLSDKQLDARRGG